MMTLNETLALASNEGVVLSCVDGKLKYEAPLGLTDELREALKANREEVIRIVARPVYDLPCGCKHCGKNSWRYEPLAFNMAGGHVCKGCYHSIRA